MTMASASYPGELNSDQVRSARGWLAWSQKDLAEKASVAVSTVADFERGQRKPMPANIEALRTALEKGGALFHVDGSVSGPLPSTVPRSKRAGMPVRWIEEGDLAAWANRIDGAFSLPQLVSHLIDASLGHEVERLRFPAAEGVRQAGWDGRTKTSVAKHRYIPKGEACWELTAQQDNIQSKATEDYTKRTKAADEPGKATFVFVTLHHWSKKEVWAKERKKSGPWRDVRVYDAADLVHWIEQTPAVGLWLATRLGKRPAGVRELDAFWEEWSSATKWPLTMDLVLRDRDEDAVELQKWLRGEPGVLSLQATSADEVVAFFHATLADLPAMLRDVYRARCLVAETSDAARRLIEAPAPLYVIMTEPDAGVAARLVKQGHSVFMAYGERPESHGVVTMLARPSREQIKDALVAAGIAEASAQRYARDCARNLTVLRRLIPAHGGDVPHWAKAPPRALLAALLAGGWDSNLEADRECLVALAGAAAYSEVEAALRSFVDTFGHRSFGNTDQPIKEVGAIWRIASIYDAWPRLARHLTRADLDRFADVAREVLCTRDPRIDVEPSERWMAAVRGVEPKHSAVLRHGIGQVLIALALWGDNVGGDSNARWRADAVVKAAMHDADAARWWSLRSDFRLLAEASPDAFLTAIEHSLDQPDPPIRALLETHDGGVSGSQYLSNLLWALETLAWSSEWLPRVTHILARLDALDTNPGRHGNRPMGSLRKVYLLWKPQTGAPLDERLDVLDGLRAEQNDAAWKLLLELLPHGMDSTTSSPMPRWRDFSRSVAEGVTNALVLTGAIKVSERLVDDAGISATRWAGLLERLRDLKPDASPALEKLEGALSSISDTDDRDLLWRALRGELSRRRRRRSAKGRPPDEVLDRLDAIYRRLEPTDRLQQVAWLFEQRVELPDPTGDGWEARGRAVDVARVAAARRLLAGGGVAAAIALAAKIGTAGSLGKAVYEANLSDADLDELLEASLPSDDESVRNLAYGLIVSAFRDRREAWAERLIAKAKDRGWSEAAMLTILRALPMKRWTWDQAVQAGPTIDAAYWRGAPDFLVDDGRDDVAFAIRKFITVGRARHALSLADRGEKASSIPSDLLVEVLTHAYQQPLGRDEDSNELSDYHVTEVLEALDQRSDVSPAVVADLEWKYLALLEHSSRPPKVLPRVLAEDPAIFMTLVRAVFRPSDGSGIVEPPADDAEQARLRAQQSYRLLEMWDVVPGTRDDGTIDAGALEAWIEEARALAKTHGRMEVADIQIGKVLSASPVGRDGHWPAEAVREVLDLFRSEDLMRGFEIGTYNRRGVTSRGLRDGGEQERQEAAKYRAWAKAIRAKHRYTAKALDSIADSYERDARRHDEGVEHDDLA